MGAILGAVLLTVVGSGEALAQGYNWKYWAGSDGAYDVGDGTRDNPTRRIRFINVEYNGPANYDSWRKCFLDAVGEYRRTNVTHALGGNYNFFEVGGLSENVKRIVGWFDEKSGTYGFVVINRIEKGVVNYGDNNGTGFDIGANPDNFYKWKIGYEPGDHGPGITYYVAVQLWKHKGTASPNAGVAFWFRRSGSI